MHATPGLSIDPVTGVISGTLDSSASAGGPYSVTITADDGHGGQATQTFTWVVNNPVPVALDDSYTAGEDAAPTVVGNAVTDNDTDVDGDLLTAVPVTVVAAGSNGGRFTLKHELAGDVRSARRLPWKISVISACTTSLVYVTDADKRDRYGDDLGHRAGGQRFRSRSAASATSRTTTARRCCWT
ncbi:MAG: putative Ig domain-containing protein [Pirellulales bacterium]